MILSFKDKVTEDIYCGNETKISRKIPVQVHKIARRKIDWIESAYTLDDLKSPPGNRLEKLKGELSEYYSIRINDKFRIIFIWENGNAKSVQIVDYHD